MNVWIAIALGGAGGAMSRYWFINHTNQWLGTGFPFGTLIVNVLGSFLLGFLSFFLAQKLNVSVEVKLALTVGFLGSFTTFSTFSMDVLHAFLEGQIVKALIYILSSVSASLIGVYLGYLCAKPFA